MKMEKKLNPTFAKALPLDSTRAVAAISSKQWETTWRAWSASPGTRGFTRGLGAEPLVRGSGE